LVAKTIDINHLQEYVRTAFENDFELIDFYDKSVSVSSIEEICENVCDKLESLIEPCELRGILVNDKIVGYFAFSQGILTSFGLNLVYRNEEYLKEFWELIKSEIGGSFQCCLFGHNLRAIKYLEKMEMKIILENMTILYHAGN
jgi:hypothetical protein